MKRIKNNVLVLDERSFEQTAEAVWIMNPTIHRLYPTKEALLSFMHSMAEQYCFQENNSFFATAGFCLTGFNAEHSPKQRHVTATVMAYTALKYIGRNAELTVKPTLKHCWLMIRSDFKEKLMNDDIDRPSFEELEDWMNDSGCEAACPEGCWVEHDGYCSHGKPSWFIVLGLI